MMLLMFLMILLMVVAARLPEAGRGEVPADHVEGVGVEPRAGGGGGPRDRGQHRAGVRQRGAASVLLSQREH